MYRESVWLERVPLTADTIARYGNGQLLKTGNTLVFYPNPSLDQAAKRPTEPVRLWMYSPYNGLNVVQGVVPGFPIVETRASSFQDTLWLFGHDKVLRLKIDVGEITSAIITKTDQPLLGLCVAISESAFVHAEVRSQHTVVLQFYEIDTADNKPLKLVRESRCRKRANILLTSVHATNDTLVLVYWDQERSTILADHHTKDGKHLRWTRHRIRDVSTEGLFFSDTLHYFVWVVQEDGAVLEWTSDFSCWHRQRIHERAAKRLLIEQPVGVFIIPEHDYVKLVVFRTGLLLIKGVEAQYVKIPGIIEAAGNYKGRIYLFGTFLIGKNEVGALLYYPQKNFYTPELVPNFTRLMIRGLLSSDIKAILPQ
ncbi:MAG: hypothetical protein QXS54_00700 [Candidatus Methanomethylicaceae archaeon]